MAFGGLERRMRTRYKVRVPFVIKNNGQEIHGTTRNISLLGISAYSDSHIAQVQPVQCVLNLPNAPRPLVAHGTVIRCEPLTQPNPDGSHEIGVFFKEFAGSGESDLSKFLNHVSLEERSAIQAGYRALKQRAAARKRRKRLEALERRRRKLRRLRRRRQRLAQQKRLKAKQRAQRKKSVRLKKRRRESS